MTAFSKEELDKRIDELKWTISNDIRELQNLQGDSQTDAFLRLFLVKPF